MTTTNTPGAWIPLTTVMPDPELHHRVLVYTDGAYFNGEQVFDVDAETLNDCFYGDPDDQPEVCKAATHWMPINPPSRDKRMAIKHTPGPWDTYSLWPDRFFVGDYNRGKGPYRTLVDCSPRKCIDGSGNHTPSDEECVANAKLVSAAPELLSSLEKLEVLASLWHSTSRWTQKNVDALNAVLEESRAAIAKATRKEQ